jgi:hypothetical protein
MFVNAAPEQIWNLICEPHVVRQRSSTIRVMMHELTFA